MRNTGIYTLHLENKKLNIIILVSVKVYDTVMNFCPDCETYLKKNITPDDKIIFECIICGLRLNGTDEDTLLQEEFMQSAIVDLIHEQFVLNSAHDDAGNKVMRDCSKCGLNFMTKIRRGETQTVLYTCTCGNREELS